MAKSKYSKENNPEKIGENYSEFTYSSLLLGISTRSKKVFKRHPIISVVLLIVVCFFAFNFFVTDGIYLLDDMFGSYEDNYYTSNSMDSLPLVQDSAKANNGGISLGSWSMSGDNSKNVQYSDAEQSVFFEETPKVDSQPVIETGASSDDLFNANNKIIYTGSLSVRTSKFTETNNLVRQKVVYYGGYIEGYNISDNYATYTVRIPAKNFDAYMSDTDIHTGNNVTSNVSSKDVTLSYSETESVLNSLRVREERLLTYLSQAANITDMLSIEEELQEVRGQIESHQNQLNLMDSFISYSSITVDVRSINTSMPVTNISFIDKLLETLQEACDDFVYYGEEFLFEIILSIPMLFFVLLRLGVVVLIIWLIFMFIKKLINRRRKKKALKGTFKSDVKDNETLSDDITDELIEE